MSKDKAIVAIAPQTSGYKKEHGEIIGVKVENGNVLATFAGKKNTRDVPFKDLDFPHHKARTAAEALRNEAIPQFTPD